jgi:PAS domain-containing protein
MFNPALVELTTLQPDFLTRRPTMLSVLDAMRDRNLLPEPKDYHSWRRQIIEMERAAATGLFQENWALPDGQTFRVTGRPHPNGGLALMIEDISGEMQRSRRYRSDLEISQSVIDRLEDAIVVFDQGGHLLWCNTAYSTLWNHDPAASLGDSTIRSVTAQWKTLTAPTQLWIEIDEFIHTIGNREAWSKDLRLLDGRLLTCAVAPLAAGSTMVAFRATGPMRTGSGLDHVPSSATAAR